MSATNPPRHMNAKDEVPDKPSLVETRVRRPRDEEVVLLLRGDTRYTPLPRN